jgi:hypothetical protein
MWECQHAECHNVQNCAICSKEGATWCPHQGCRHQNPARPMLSRAQSRAQPRSAGPRGITWTPTVAGNVLKVAFVAAAAAGTWWLLHSGGSGSPEERALLSPDAGAPTDDFSSWEPQS